MHSHGEPGTTRRETPLFQCFHVTKRTPDGRTVFDDATLEIHRRDFVCLLGPTGSGKTAFFRMLLGLEPPSGGQVFFQGRNIQRMAPGELPRLRRCVGIVLQDLKLLPGRNAFANAALPLAAAGRDRLFVEDRVRRVFRLVELEDRMYVPVDRLNAVEKKRLAFARAMANEPLVLLADEPAGMLDEDGARAIFDLLRRVHLQGVAVVAASNDLSLPAVFPGSRTVSIDGGRLVEGPMTLRGGRRLSAAW